MSKYGVRDTRSGIMTSCRLRRLKPCSGPARCLHADITCNFLSPLACTGNGKPKKSVALVEPVSLNQTVTELVMAKFGSEPRSEPEPDRTGLQFGVRVRVMAWTGPQWGSRFGKSPNPVEPL